jgi:hypothetical protein
MKLFGFFNVPEPWTLANWQNVLGDDLFLRSLRNTVVLLLGTAAAAIVVHSLIAYIVVRTPYGGRRLLDFVSWLPFTVPGIILGLALLWLFLGVAPSGLSTAPPPCWSSRGSSRACRSGCRSSAAASCSWAASSRRLPASRAPPGGRRTEGSSYG